MNKILLATSCAMACVMLLAGGCAIAPPVRGSGVVISQPRQATGFNAVALAGIGTVRIKLTGTESLTVEAEDNLLPLLITTVENGTLKIAPKSSVNLSPTRPVIFHVTASRIESLSVSGAGNIDAGDLNSEQFTARVSGSGNLKLAALEAQNVTARISGSGGIRIERVETRNLKCDISGSGNVRLAGRADQVELCVSGSGSLAAADLACHAADVSITGSGGATIGTTRDRLNADISGSGSLRYRGTPPIIETHVSGSGSVSPG
jgi:hypothetical protein